MLSFEPSQPTLTHKDGDQTTPFSRKGESSTTDEQKDNKNVQRKARPERESSSSSLSKSSIIVVKVISEWSSYTSSTDRISSSTTIVPGEEKMLSNGEGNPHFSYACVFVFVFVLPFFHSWKKSKMRHGKLIRRKKAISEYKLMYKVELWASYLHSVSLYGFTCVSWALNWREEEEEEGEEKRKGKKLLVSLCASNWSCLITAKFWSKLEEDERV